MLTKNIVRKFVTEIVKAIVQDQFNKIKKDITVFTDQLVILNEEVKKLNKEITARNKKINKIYNDIYNGSVVKLTNKNMN